MFDTSRIWLISSGKAPSLISTSLVTIQHHLAFFDFLYGLIEHPTVINKGPYLIAPSHGGVDPAIKNVGLERFDKLTFNPLCVVILAKGKIHTTTSLVLNLFFGFFIILCYRFVFVLLSIVTPPTSVLAGSGLHRLYV